MHDYDVPTPTVAAGIQPHCSSDLCRVDFLFHAIMEDDTQDAHGQHKQVTDNKTI